MTIDHTGRTHRPAGSPASTGGQFAPTPTPGAAQELGLSPAENRQLVFAMAADSLRRLAAAERFDQFRDKARDAWPEATHLTWPGHAIARARLVNSTGTTIARPGSLYAAIPAFADLRAEDLIEYAEPDDEPTRPGDLRTYEIDLDEPHRPDVDLAPIAAILEPPQFDELADAVDARRNTEARPRRDIAPTRSAGSRNYRDGDEAPCSSCGRPAFFIAGQSHCTSCLTQLQSDMARSRADREANTSTR